MTEVPENDLRPIGLWIFLAALTTLMGASIVGYLIVRLRAPVWPPEGIPSIPVTIWISTLLLVLGSFTIHHGMRELRRDRQAGFRRAFAVTLTLGLLFLLCQVWNGAALLTAVADRPKELYSFTYIMLASLHAAHLLGGLIPLTLVTRRAFAGRYSARNQVGPRLVAIYWHYLDAVWLVMCVLLML